MLAPGYKSFKLQHRICYMPKSYLFFTCYQRSLLFTEVTPDLEKSIIHLQESGKALYLTSNLQVAGCSGRFSQAASI